MLRIAQGSRDPSDRSRITSPSSVSTIRRWATTVRRRSIDQLRDVIWPHPPIRRIAYARMREDEEQFVSGYSCPNCGKVSVGIGLADAGESESAWSFRVAVSDEMRIRCSNCGFDVPRDRWTLAERR